MIQRIASELGRRGVGTQPTDSCPAVKVRVEQPGPDLLLAIEDPYGRKSERTVADADAAATVIESWARWDVTASLLAGWSYASLVPPPSPAPEPVVVETSAPRRARSVASVALAGETSVAYDGSVWLGAAVAGCFPWGPVCIGGTARWLTGTGVGTRMGADVLASVDLPLYLGRALVLPGVGVGAGWIAMRDTGVEQTQEIDNLGLRADAHASLSYPLGGDFWFQVGLSADVSLMTEDASNQDTTGAPGEPRGYLRGTVGLRLGAP